MSDSAVIRFAKACPNLIHVKLDGGIHLTDESLLALFTNCPNLRYIQFSGNDKVAGNLRGAALDVVRERPVVCQTPELVPYIQKAVDDDPGIAAGR